MSEENVVGPLFFEFPTTPNRAKDSESSEAVSPTTSVRSQTQHSNKSLERRGELRPSAGRRSKSEQSPRPKFHVQTIEEGVVHVVDRANEYKSRPYFEEHLSAGLEERRSSSSTRAYESAQQRFNQRGTVVINPQRPSLRRATEDRAVSKSKQRISWSRSSSGSPQALTQRPSPPCDDSSSVRSYFSRPVTIQRPRTPILPLKPPRKSLPPTPQSLQDHKVKMETPFTILRPDSSTLPVKSTARRSKSRTGSINPLFIFSAPLTGLRRFSRGKRERVSISTLRSPQRISPTEARDHQSMLKREQTGAVLNRVSTLLECMRPPKIKTLNFRSMSDRSESSQNSKACNGTRNSMRHEQGHIDQSVQNGSTANNNRRSYSSSLVRLRMGPTPSNTLNERATYKIKRSPSAETEEFPKIDISVRGGTSYLPSEARRIHTPPLPEDGRNGMRRGFFFDYNAPRLNKETRVPCDLNDATGDEAYTEAKPANSPAKRNITIGKRYTKEISRKGVQTKAGDWYDTQLAELDGSSGDEAVVAPSSNKSSPGAKKVKDEHLLDYSIPEHLPSSPLCPRNPKYWRVVKGKGSQFRGCWMHGFGEYE